MIEGGNANTGGNMRMSKETTCFFTGHRLISAAEKARLPGLLSQAIEEMVQKGMDTFIAGGALGFDTLAAEAVIEARGRYPQIHLVLALPCEDQARLWRPADVERYERIKSQADRVEVLSAKYEDGCMQTRNRYMVGLSSWCIAYCTRAAGGTASTLRYAFKRGLSIINLAKRP